MGWLKDLGSTVGKLIKGGGNPAKVVNSVVSSPTGVSELLSAGNTVKKLVIGAGTIATAGGLGAALAGGGTLASKLVKGADVLKSSSSGNFATTLTSKLTGSLTSSNPIVGKLVDGLKSSATNLIRSNLTSTYKPTVINSPLVDQFTETKTGLQQSVFGSPVSDSYTSPLDVSWKNTGMDDFNISSGDVELSKGKKDAMPVWAWVVGGIVTFFVSLMLLMGKIKFR